MKTCFKAKFMLKQTRNFCVTEFINVAAFIKYINSYAMPASVLVALRRSKNIILVDQLLFLGCRMQGTAVSVIYIQACYVCMYVYVRSHSLCVA